MSTAATGVRLMAAARMAARIGLGERAGAPEHARDDKSYRSYRSYRSYMTYETYQTYETYRLSRLFKVPSALPIRDYRVELALLRAEEVQVVLDHFFAERFPGKRALLQRRDRLR